MPKPKRDSSNSHGMYIVMGQRSKPRTKAGRKKPKLPKVQVQRKDETPPILEEDTTSSPDGRNSFSPVKYAR